MAAAIGEIAVKDLACAFQGQILYIPKHIEAQHAIAQAVGLDAARQLCDNYGGLQIAIPVSLSRRLRAHRLHVAFPGWTAGRIAAEIGVTTRAVQIFLSEAEPSIAPRPKDERQGRLF